MSRAQINRGTHGARGEVGGHRAVLSPHILAGCNAEGDRAMRDSVGIAIASVASFIFLALLVSVSIIQSEKLSHRVVLLNCFSVDGMKVREAGEDRPSLSPRPAGCADTAPMTKREGTQIGIQLHMFDSIHVVFSLQS
jgi:hypothetical protein